MTIPSTVNSKRNIDFDLHRLIYLMNSVAGQKLSQHDSPITYSQYLVLNSIAKNGKINQRQLSKIISISDAAISRQVDLLKQRKFLKAETNKANRRERILCLTNHGELAVNQAEKVIESIFSTPSYSIEDQEIISFNLTIDKLIGVFSPMKQN